MNFRQLWSGRLHCRGPNGNNPTCSSKDKVSFVFPMCFGPDEDHHQIKRNFRNLLYICLVMTSTQNKICIFNFFDEH